MQTIDFELFAATLWLIFNQRDLLNVKTINLLRKIEAKGSLSKAAEAVSMSYKGAWDRIEKLNISLNKTIVITTIGGQNGGKSELSVYGKQLLFLFTVLEKNYRKLFALTYDKELSVNKFFRMITVIYSKMQPELPDSKIDIEKSINLYSTKN